MVGVQCYPEAVEDGCDPFLAPSCGGMNFLDSFDHGLHGSDPSPEESAWMVASDMSSEWEAWADPQWQNTMLNADWSTAWGAYQHHQWTAALLSSRSWAGLDPMAMSLASEVLGKPTKVVAPSMPWTEMSLDPEKPSTPANKSRSLARKWDSEVKLPAPVGSGRRRDNFQENESSKVEPWKATPLKLSLPSPALSQPQGSAIEEAEDPIARLSASLPQSFGRGLSPSLIAPSSSQTGASSPSSGSSTTDSAHAAGSTSRGLRVQRTASQADSAGQAVTTVMVRNVPSSVKQSGFVKELEDTGFGGLFDFCYLPSAFDTGKNKGYAFVNFVDTASFSDFVECWHGSKKFNARAADPALNVSAAALQGLERNIEKWDAPRMRRVRNPEYRPYVVKNERTSMVPDNVTEVQTIADTEVSFHREYPAAVELPPGLVGSAHEPVPSSTSVPWGAEFELAPPPGLTL